MNVLTTWGVGLANGASSVSIDSVGAQPAVLLESLTPSVLGSESAGYVLPRSAGLNPTGYTYQTYGGWIAFATFPILIDGYFSTGVPTTQAFAVSGSATYSGQSDATFVDAATGDFFDVTSTVTVQVDFSARTLTLSTTATTSVPVNVSGNASASASLNLTGVLSYPVATNTFTGTVTTANGMSGNVTGRFYGPVLSGATTNKSIGSPMELGGTFAVSLPAIGTLQGSFGAQ